MSVKKTQLLNSEEIEISQYLGSGFLPVTSFGSWRVAMLGYADRFSKSGMTRIEKHSATDEVFVLLEGEAEICIAGKGESVCEIKWIPMQKNMVYNVKKDVWHHIALKEGSYVLIVENNNTGIDNTQYFSLEDQMK